MYEKHCPWSVRSLLGTLHCFLTTLVDLHVDPHLRRRLDHRFETTGWVLLTELQGALVVLPNRMSPPCSMCHWYSGSQTPRARLISTCSPEHTDVAIGVEGVEEDVQSKSSNETPLRAPCSPTL